MLLFLHSTNFTVINMNGDYSCGLVLEGGGSRGIFTSGVLDAFIDAGIEFPYVIGVSAGSCNAASFIGKNYRRQHDITINYCNDKRYMSVQSIIKNGQYLNLEWDFGELTYDIMPLDYDTYEKSNTQLCAVATNAKTGKPEYFYPKDLREYGCPYLKASCALPVATRGVEIGGETYFDGGITDSIPLKRAFEDGCKKAVVILTQVRGFVKQPIKQQRAVHRILKKYPALAEAVLNRHEMYNRQLEYIFEQEKKGSCMVIAPARDLNCSAIEKNTDKLERIYQLGLAQGKMKTDEIKALLKES